MKAENLIKIIWGFW